MRLLLTGGAGFPGSRFHRSLPGRPPAGAPRTVTVPDPLSDPLSDLLAEPPSDDGASGPRTSVPGTARLDLGPGGRRRGRAASHRANRRGRQR